MIGARLGNRYELIEKIGEGGMAEVYKAKCHLLNRFVAVKILKNQYSDNAEFVNKFKYEASAAASLSHNNIVGIYDIGSENGINYIVMEYVDGKTLKQIINEKKVLKTDEAIVIAMQIAKALECAHNNNIIHRDVKPHNILVTKDGIIKVTDFGIAKATSSVTITNSDRVIGSAHYFSPEQAKGSFVDCKTDIYSLGIVMYEMVTGKVPYDAESPVSVALKHIQEPVVPPKEINSDIPDSLNNIILKSIEKEPYKRYHTSNELFIDLEKIKNNPDSKITLENKENEYTRVMKPITEATTIINKGSYTKNVNDEDEEYDEDEDEEEDNYKHKLLKKRPKISGKTKKIIISSLAIFSILIIGITAYFVSQNKLRSQKGKNVTVPKIIGIAEEEAKKKVEELGLKFAPSTESSDKPKGVVIKCFPEEGKEINTGEVDEIRVIVSSGPRVAAIPNLIDVEIEAAKEYLRTYNLKLGKTTFKYSNIEKNRVCGQSPEPGTEIGENTTVDLVVSRGLEVKTVKVPNVVNKIFDEAMEILESSKLKLGTITKIPTSDESLDGKVSVQSIEPNSEVKEGTVINLSYYAYGNKDLVDVPNFVDKTISEAKSIAAQNNLNIQVSGKGDFIIVAQSVSPGKKVPQGTTIRLRSEPNP
ncbi:Stk1 family PASTA domain-containing Ser/Thr kinase [Clostridium sp. MB40-C1]|uniref:Stk1 family PASTA domain-containing Ser/Thr kinase n=1 Tax=Clostridium sp. MB40-C1 TaxID=3070996 RepID=UPI0027E014B0|nr:Stk1 family PASTA domain-containing Ser/Thr kinase [Clostridium sp. MB40-C1]WMJ82094.1 Stk1 family PASTA domain-containing Ser/Thr kinase [Clostridium sp. MB40-C1]